MPLVKYMKTAPMRKGMPPTKSAPSSDV
jgi:hypothetical protein